MACQKNLTVPSTPQRVEPAQRREFDTNMDSVEDLDAVPYIDFVENIADSMSQTPQPPLPLMETNPGAGAPLIDNSSKHWERDGRGFHERNLQNTSFYPFAMCEEYKCIQCRIKQKGMKTNDDNVPKKENTALRIRTFNLGNGIQKLLASMADDQALGEWELHTLEDMKWTDSHQRPIKYWSRDFIRSMRWLMQQPAYPDHLIYAPRCHFNRDTPPKRRNTEINTAD